MSRHRDVKGANGVPELDATDSHSNNVSSPDTRADIKPAPGCWDYVDYSRLPSFLHDNEFLTRCHRPQLNSVAECLKSAFMLHSETWNIWTHVFGVLAIFLVSCYYIAYIANNFGHRLSFVAFFFGAIFCMGSSALYHAFICHSETVCKLLAKLDYCGVIVLIVTSHIPWLHFVFYCDSHVQCFYICCFFAIGTAAICFVMRDEFRRPAYRWIRFLLFALLGLSSIIPATHSVLIDNILSVMYVPAWLPFMAALYLVGGLTYAVRFPECLLPGTFDIWCQSHQIMHLCVIGGVMSCYKGAADVAVQRLSLSDDCQINTTAAAFV